MTLALGYLPFLRRFYAPADARGAFVAVRDAAAGFGGHIVAIPRDNLPILTKPASSDPIWNAGDEWLPVTPVRHHAGAKTAILSVGAPSYIAIAAADHAAAKGAPADVYVVNGFPLPEAFLQELPQRYQRVVTLEDGLIGTPETGIRGFAGLVAGNLYGTGAELEHFGIADPHVAPSDTFQQVWEHYGITEDRMLAALLRQS